MVPRLNQRILYLLLSLSPICCDAFGRQIESGKTSDPADTAVMDLSGRWAVQLDPESQGIKQNWPDDNWDESAVDLPGSIQSQGIGDPVTIDTPWVGGIADRSWFTDPKYEPYRQPDNIKLPFWLQPERYYMGPAWYQRSVEIPADWQGKRITLSLERCHWASTVWVDGRRCGSEDSLSTPHVYDLSERLTPGVHRLTICIDNRIKVGVGINSHSVTDHTQSNWNGVVGRLELRAASSVWLDDVQVFPSRDCKHARVQIEIRKQTEAPVTGSIRLNGESCDPQQPLSFDAKSVEFRIEQDSQATLEVEYPLPAGIRTWDEFQPALYRLQVELQTDGDQPDIGDTREVVFGVRDVRPVGTQLLVNDRPIFLRGTLECCIFPRTGYPPTDVDSWKHILQRCRLHGLNHVRFHSWCPPEAAFVAADEMGFYLQVECGSWANQGDTIGDEKPVDVFIWREQQRILRCYGNHPSFLMMAYGNEPAGKHQREFLGRLVKHWKQTDPRRVYTSTAGWPAIPENQYHNVPNPRIQAGRRFAQQDKRTSTETVTDYREFISQNEVPIVSHEIGQWCVYPNFDEIPKYTGVLKPKNFEIFRDFLGKNAMADQAKDFLMASGRLQVACYKEEIESSLRTPGFGGFQLLDLHDFPGQGTALVGILDPFWDSKPYISDAEFRRFCNQTVPLARLPKRVFETGDTLDAQFDIAHFGPNDLTNATVIWRLIDDKKQIVADGRLATAKIVTGQLNEIGSIQIALKDMATPAHLSLQVGIEDTTFENDWDVWLYPRDVPNAASDEIVLANCLDESTRQQLKSGGKVLLQLKPATVRTESVLGFSSIFWNTAWTNGQPPHTLGILCDPQHPALAAFPTQYHSDWQWWYLVSQAAAMQLDGLPTDLPPLVQVIDTWFESRRLGLVFEASVEGGKLLVCSIDLDQQDNNPVARQLKHSLLQYMASDEFRPQTDVNWDSLNRLTKPVPKLLQLGAKITADSQHAQYPVSQAIDGDPSTIWHTDWEPQPVPQPHHLQIDLLKPTEIAGISYLPRQDMTNGRIAKYAIYASNDPSDWGEPIAEGIWSAQPDIHKVMLAEQQTVRYLKLVSLSEVNEEPFASIAEFDVITQ